MNHYKRKLSKDPKLKKYLKIEVDIPKGSKNITASLIDSILAQQLSTKVAKVMQDRFWAIFKNKKPKAEEIIKLSVDKIRGIGISQQKANYILNVAEFVVKNKITNSKLARMSDEEVIELLTQIKGVGRWTVEMILIFSMKREDVFAVDDLGIQKGMQEIFKLQKLSKKELTHKMMELSKRWSPYRSYVCLHLWSYKDRV